MENSRVSYFREVPGLRKGPGRFMAPLGSAVDACLVSPLEDRSNLLLKRSVDVLFSTILILFVLSWLLPLIALWIRLDSKGPVFFLQKRHKRNARYFTCLKFRTMVVNAEADLLPAVPDDRRITRAGRFLRNHHLDELPQLLNVWWGDMSLIGPRPYMISDSKLLEGMIQQYVIRYRVKPGITGLAQSMGFCGYLLDPLQLRRRLELDMNYIHHWSLKLDLWIIFKTIRKIISF
ncbi:MAG: sugar transferase [Flavisolibacter sp.]